MSTLKLNRAQFGQSATASNNFSLEVPTVPDGTLTLGKGVPGAITTDILKVGTNGNIRIGSGTVGTGKLEVAGGRTLLKANSETYSLGLQYSDSTSPVYIGASNNSSNQADMIFSNSGGSELVRITSAGNVGIGTVSPANATGAPSVTINGTNGGRVDLKKSETNYLTIYSAGTNLADIEANGASTALRFNTNGAERLRINADGSITTPNAVIGLGTTPSVSAYSSINSAIEISTMAANYPYIDFHCSNTWQDYNVRLGVEGSTAGNAGGTLRITAAGTLISGSNPNGSTVLTLHNTGISASVNGSCAIYGANENGQPTSFLAFEHPTDGSGYMSLYTTPAGARTSNRGVLTASIEYNGTTIGNNISVNGGIYLNSARSTTGVGVIGVYHANGVANGNSFHTFLYNNTVIGSITQATTSSVAYNTTSDQRLKENIVPANNALPIIDQLQVKSFDWKNDGIHEPFGLIAQEAVQVVPNAVHTPISEEDYMGIDYSKLVPLLIKSIQELTVKLEENNQSHQQLKAEFDAYKLAHA